MFLQRYFRIAGTSTTGVMLMCAFISVGTCQTTSDQESEPALSETPEEANVEATQSIQRLGRDVIAAEANFFGVFNEFNSDDSYDVKCGFTTALGSRRKVHECKAVFLREYEANLASRYNYSLGGAGRGATPNVARIKKKQERLRKKIAAALSEHPELLVALNELAAAKQALVSEHQRRD